MNIFEKIKEKWDEDKIPPNYNHTDDNPKRNDLYKRFVIDLSKYNFENKIIIDYGCGGGWLGKFLLDNFNIKKYIGIDISNKSLKFARKNLKNYDNVKLIKIKEWFDLKEYKADIFITLSCIQHFPTIEYLKKFFEMVNNSGCDELIIQYRLRHTNEVMILEKNVLTWAMFLPKNSIDKYLTNYNRWGGFNLKTGIIKRFAYFKLKEELKEGKNVIDSTAEECINEPIIHTCENDEVIENKGDEERGLES